MQKLFKADLGAEFRTRERCSIVELVNDPNFPDFSVARCRVEVGVTTELHSLNNTKEVYVVLEGNGLIDDGNSEGRAVGPMDCIQIPMGYPQRITNSGCKDLIFLAICAKRFEPKVYQSHEGSDKVEPDYSSAKP